MIDTKELEQAIEESVRDRIQIYARNAIWSSSLGHPCLRQQEYFITRGNDQLKISVGTKEVFEEGNIHEAAIMDKLRKAGFNIRRSGRPLIEPVRKDGKEFRYKISGRLDFEITHDKMKGEWYPVEAKSMEPFGWRKINTIQDMFDSKRYYIRAYPLQMMMYLYSLGRELGLMILKNKVTGKLKFLWIWIDYDMVEKLLKKAEAINEAVAKIEADPDKAEELLTDRIPYDEDICGQCAFRHICLPDQAFGGEEIDLDKEIEKKLHDWAALKSFASQFKELDEEIKKRYKQRGPGKYLVGANFDVTVKEVTMPTFAIPKEIKEKYRVENIQNRVTIREVLR